jgi:multiple sugar transport system permease protein
MEDILQHKKRHLSAKGLPYIFIAPAVILIGVLIVYPVSNVFYYSLQHFNPNKPYLNGFAGLDNFIRILTNDTTFYQSLSVSLKWVVSQVSLQLALGLITALLLNQRFRGRGLVRGLVFAPWAISGVIVALMWSLMYNENLGVINDILLRLGIIKVKIAWLADTQTALGALIVAELWRGIPFFAISLLAALQAIPEEIYESCRVDGAGRWSSFIYITLPYLKNTIVLTTLLRAVWEFKAVDVIMNLTGGGPINTTTTLSMYLVQQAITIRNFGYGSAIAVLIFLCLLLFTIFYLKLSGFGKEEQ